MLLEAAVVFVFLPTDVTCVPEIVWWGEQKDTEFSGKTLVTWGEVAGQYARLWNPDGTNPADPEPSESRDCSAPLNSRSGCSAHSLDL